jgi:hypothetical protein
MCAEEFTSFLNDAKKSPIEEKVNAFGEIVEKIMTIVLRIPDLVDDRIASLMTKINTLSNDINALKTRAATSPVAPGAAPGVAPGAAPGPPPPPGGTPGGPPGPPPPPGGPPGGPLPGPRAPASPQSLRGAIMGELKQLFAKRKQ